MSRHEVGFWILVGVSFCYPLAMRALAHMTRYTRSRILVLGNELLASAALPFEHKRLVANTITDAFDWKFMPNACLMYPILSAKWMLGGNRPTPPDIHDKAIRIKYDDYMTYHIQLCAAANPFFAVVLAIECAVLAFILTPFGMSKQMLGIAQATAAKVEEKRHAQPANHQPMPT